MRTILLLLLSILITGCSTAYQDGTTPLSIFGGYGSEKGPGNLDKVFFAANGYTSAEKANKYALRRAAELGKQKGMPYFSIYQTLSDAAAGKKATSPSVDLTMDKPTAYFYVDYHRTKEPGDFSVTEVLFNTRIRT